MKPISNLLLCGSIFIIILASLFIILPKKSELKGLSKKKILESDQQDDMLKAWYQEFLMTRDPVLNKVPTERIIEAKRQMDLQGSQARPDEINALTWQERGPNNIGGRTRAFLVDANDGSGNTVFAAGVGGGVWKTTNFKTTCTWTVINDFFSNIAVTCIKQNPTNAMEMYFGTGEGFGNFDAIDGLGIWKSTNGGSSWTQLSSTISLSYVNDLEFDNNGYIYAATRSTVTGMRGIIRSSDGGVNWTQVVTDPIPTAITRGADLERAANGDMYATLGIFSTGHIFRSNENGVNTGISGSWIDITPASVITNKDQRIELAVCPSNGLRIYAVTQDSITFGISTLFRSDNRGGSWTTLSNASWCDQGASTNADFSRGQAWYDLIIGIDPSNADLAMVGGVVVVKTTNSGTSWTQATRWTTNATCTTAPVIHADIHEIKFLSSTELIICTDGGIYYSTDGGASFTNKNGGYNVTQYYGVAVHPTSGSNYMLGGTQDNGTHKFTTAGINAVTTATGGDGGFCFINQNDPNYQITSFTNSSYSRSTNGGSSFATVISNSNGRFINPTALDNATNFLYFGFATGYYAHYDVANNSAASIDLTASPSNLTLTDLQVSAIKVDADTTNTIWLGYSTSETSATEVVPCLVKVIKANGPSSGNPSLKPVGTRFDLPGSIPAGAYISSIDIEAGNRNHMLITISNYGVISVWESVDAGINWTSVEGDLPDMPVRWGMFIPSGYTARPEAIGGVMLATELGVWTTASLNGSSTAWVANNTGLANVRSDQLVLRNSDKLVAVATHGRGVFTTSLLTPPLPVTLVDFRGQLTGKKILLSWETVSEFNSKHFDLEKSFDGINFHSITKIPAAGNSNNLLHYSYLDPELPAELNYYRLKSVDIDDRSKLSDVVLIKLSNAKQGMHVLTNPFRDNISIRFIKIPKGKLELRLSDMSGKLLTNRSYDQLSQPMIQFSLANRIPSGVYLLQVFTEGTRFSSKLVRE
jgi:hypothetical protein